MIECDITRSPVGKWCLKFWGRDRWGKRRGKKVHRDFSAEECDVVEVMWNSGGPLNNLQEGYHDMTWKWSGHVSERKACLCWQHPFQSIHNSHSSTSWEPYSLVACFKGLHPHRKRDADMTDQSIESHCWQGAYQGAARGVSWEENFP